MPTGEIKLYLLNNRFEFKVNPIFLYKNGGKKSVTYTSLRFSNRILA